MKTTNCYIRGIVIKRLGTHDSSSHMSDDTPLGEYVTYPVNYCYAIPEDENTLLIPSFDEFGASAILISEIEVLYVEEEMPKHNFWQEVFDICDVEDVDSDIV